MCTPCSLYLHSSIAHLYHPPSHFSPPGPQPWSPPLPWPSAGIPADASAPLRADNSSSLTLLQLSSPPHWQSSPTDVSLLICRPKQQSSLPPVMLTVVFACTCGLTLLLFSADTLTSLSPPYLPVPQQPALCTLPASRPSSAAGWEAVWGTDCSAGISGRQEGQMMAHW